MSIVLFADFTRKNGVVTDTSTLLEWQDSYVDNSNEVKGALFAPAISYCENLILNGYSDWRLPNIKELLSLVDDAYYAPAINPIFKNTYSFAYISSTTTSSSGYNIWYVSFNKGQTFTDSKAYDSGYIRCVR